MIGKAVAASFLVYLLPLIGPHGGWLLAIHLLRPRAPEWVALDWAAALGLQLVAAGLAYGCFRWRTLWRWLLVVVAVPVFWLVAEWAFLYAIPARVLIERDTATEHGDWPEVCLVTNWFLTPVRGGEPWLSNAAATQWAILNPSSCEVRTMQLPGVMMTQPSVAPGGRAVFGTWDRSAGSNQWWHFDGTELHPLPRVGAVPVLSRGGDAVAWQEPVPERVVLQSLRDGRRDHVNLPAPSGARWELLGVAEGELTFYQYTYATRQSAIVRLGLDGAQRGDPVVLSGVEPQATTVLRAASGWVAWDAYRENEAYRLAWADLPGSGSHRVPRGSGITGVAVSRDGAYIAVSTSTALNIGRTPDAVFVLRSRDGAEVWRRDFPRYTRSMVAFPSAGVFAYSDAQGTHLLRLPD